MRARTATVLLACAIGAAVIGAGASPASAASTLTATYPINGTSHLNTPNSDLPLGPGTLSAVLDLGTGALTGRVSLPPATASFTELGAISVTATVALTEAQPTTGTVNLSTGAVQSTSMINMRIADLKVAGLDIPIGDQCQTVTPATVALASQPGFSVLNGGTVSGT